MFVCTIIVVVNIRKTVYMQECMNYTITMLPLGYTMYTFTCTQHALMYFIVYKVNVSCVSSFTCVLSIDQFVTI